MTTERSQAKAPPLALVMFGASGDLTARKLLPALASLAGNGLARGRLYPHRGRQDQVDRRRVPPALPRGGARSKPAWAELVKQFRYVPGNYDHDATFKKITDVLAELERRARRGGTAGNRIYYLATIPALFGEVARAWPVTG